MYSITEFKRKEFVLSVEVLSPYIVISDQPCSGIGDLGYQFYYFAGGTAFHSGNWSRGDGSA